MMALQGSDPDDPPIKVGFPVIDIATGISAAEAILAAVVRRLRGDDSPITLDVSMVDCALALMSGPTANTLATGKAPDRVGNRGFVGSPGAETFATSDGHISVAANTMGQFATLCRLLGRPELAKPPHVPAGLSSGAFLANAATDEHCATELARAFAADAGRRAGESAQRAGVPAAQGARSRRVSRRALSANAGHRRRRRAVGAGPGISLERRECAGTAAGAAPGGRHGDVQIRREFVSARPARARCDMTGIRIGVDACRFRHSKGGKQMKLGSGVRSSRCAVDRGEHRRSTIAYAEPSGTFKYAEQVKLITMDPQQQSGSGVPYLRPVYELLFEKSPDGENVPLLATGYEIDGLNVTIKLREGINFSNGEAFNAQVAADNINRGVKLGIIEGLKTVESAEPVDEYTFRIKLKEPDPGDHRQPLLYRRDDARAGRDGRSETIDRNPIGTGPYVHSKEELREGEVQVYTPNPTYWDKDKIGLARYEVWEMPDDTARLNALKTGQIDAGNWLANPQSAIIDRSPDLKLIRNTGGLNYHVIISDRDGTIVPAFADRNVRLAMAHSIDRAAFGKAVLFGLADDSYQPYAKGNWAYNPELEGVYAYDVDKAKEYMAKSAFPDGFTFDMPSIPIYQSRLEALAGFFKEIGITMNIVPVEPGTLARRSRTTDFPATNLVWNTNTDPKFLALRYIYEDAAYNPFKIKPSEELLSLAEAGLESPDVEVRAPIYKKMAAQLAKEAFLIFVANSPILIGVSERDGRQPDGRLSLRRGFDQSSGPEGQQLTTGSHAQARRPAASRAGATAVHRIGADVFVHLAVAERSGRSDPRRLRDRRAARDAARADGPERADLRPVRAVARARPRRGTWAAPTSTA